jgi:hypothetical protein
VHQAAHLEAAENAAHIAGIQIQLLAQFSRGARLAVSDLIKHPNFRQGKLGIQETFAEKPDVAGVDTIEAADRLNVVVEVGWSGFIWGR